jgi:hypothetical protein
LVALEEELKSVCASIEDQKKNFNEAKIKCEADLKRVEPLDIEYQFHCEELQEIRNRCYALIKKNSIVEVEADDCFQDII